MFRGITSLVGMGGAALAWACGSNVVVGVGAGGATSAATVTGVASSNSGSASGASSSESSASSSGACGNVGGGGPGQWGAVSAGSYHTCAIRLDHTLWCWGYNLMGQLGIGAASEAQTPSQVVALGPSVAAIAAGQVHTCAVKLDQTLWCWGHNADGQLGDGTQDDKKTPQQVATLGAGVASVSAGSQHTCARKIDGTLWCWGAGQLGNGMTQSLKPVQVVAMGNAVVEFAVGSAHTCARKSDATLWCWGYNGDGELGNNTTADQSLPVQVSALGASVAGVSAGYHHTCARKTDGTLWCWGKNNHGQLGDGSHQSRSAPVSVDALGTGTAAVAGGDKHTCAATNSALWCWGEDNGQLGDGPSPCCSDRASPVKVCGLDAGVAWIAAGFGHTCSSKSDHSLWCWGLNGNYQLGDDSHIDQVTPVSIP